MTSDCGGEIRSKMEEGKGERWGGWLVGGRLIRDMFCGITAADEAD